MSRRIKRRYTLRFHLHEYIDKMSDNELEDLRGGGTRDEGLDEWCARLHELIDSMSGDEFEALMGKASGTLVSSPPLRLVAAMTTCGDGNKAG